VHVQSASAYSATSLIDISLRRKQDSVVASETDSAASAATSADRTTISQAARDILAAETKPAVPSGGNATAVFETSQGAKTLNIDEYFSPHANTGGSLATLPPLLLPNQKNIDALTKHISAAFPRFLAQNHVPYPPSSVTYDERGQIQLPADYPYAEQFKQALEDNPTLARELSAVSALTSHLVEMRKAIPFQEEYAAATNQAQADAVVAKYRYLFSGNRHYDIIALHFSESGSLTLTADGKPVS